MPRRRKGDALRGGMRGPRRPGRSIRRGLMRTPGRRAKMPVRANTRRAPIGPKPDVPITGGFGTNYTKDADIARPNVIGPTMDPPQPNPFEDPVGATNPFGEEIGPRVPGDYGAQGPGGIQPQPSPRPRPKPGMMRGTAGRSMSKSRFGQRGRNTQPMRKRRR